MKRLTLLLVLGLAPGCAIFEAGAKAGAEIAIDAIKAQLPGLAAGILDETKILVNRGIEEATLAAAKKTDELGGKALLYIARSAGLDPASYDLDGDGTYSETEQAMMLAAIEAKRGELPWWLELLVATGGLGAGFTVLKSTRRYINGKAAPTAATT